MGFPIGNDLAKFDPRVWNSIDRDGYMVAMWKVVVCLAVSWRWTDRIRQVFSWCNDKERAGSFCLCVTCSRLT